MKQEKTNKEQTQQKFKDGDILFDEESKQAFLFVGTYEMASKCRYATDIEIDEWNEKVLHPIGQHYSKHKKALVHWFKPYDKVVARSVWDANNKEEQNEWFPTFFAYYDKENRNFPFHTMHGINSHCLPYNEQTAKLIGTFDNL